MKLWRIIDQDGRIYHSKRFHGYYEREDSAKRAFAQLPKTRYGGYDYDRKVAKPRIAMTYTLQEADVTWTSLTSSTSSPTSPSSSTSGPETTTTFTFTTE